LKERSCGFRVYKHLDSKQYNYTVREIVSKSIQENKPEINRSESVDINLGFLTVQRSCRVDNRRNSRVSKLISDCRSKDKLDELLIFVIVLLILINLTVILIIILIVRDKKSQ
jgi:hypothetical protein